MIKIVKEEIEIDESLVSRLNVICDFCNTTPIIENGSIWKIEHTNLTYIEPHRIIINNKLYLAFTYSNEIYVHNLGKKIKLSELENYIKEKEDNPTIGIILCSDKKDTIVKYSVLDDNKNLFASKYQLYLPTEKELALEIEKQKAEFNDNN